MDVLADVHTQDYLNQIHNSNLKVYFWHYQQCTQLICLPCPCSRLCAQAHIGDHNTTAAGLTLLTPVFEVDLA